jgi:hypothetical protein
MLPFQVMVRSDTQIKEITCIYFLGMFFIILFHRLSDQIEISVFVTKIEHHLLFLLMLQFKWEFRVGLGTLLSGARVISDGMLQAAAEWYN